MDRTPDSNELRGRRFYSPDVIALYCTFSLPVGFGLYGLNEARRGRRPKGYLLAGLCGAVLLAEIAAASSGGHGSAFGNVFFGIGLLRMEGGPYRRALLQGGVGARWWPPLVWILALTVLTGILSAIFGPAPNVK